MVPKDKDPTTKKSGVIYRYKCDRVKCDEEYIGELSKTFGERFKEQELSPCLSISMKMSYGFWSQPFCSLFSPIFEGPLHFLVHTPVKYVDGYFSFSFVYFFKLSKVKFSHETEKYFSRRQAFTSFPTSKAPYPIYDHFNITGHSTIIDNFSIVRREDQNLIRAINEAIYIRVNSPSLNKNIGKYCLPHIWDEVLFNTSELKSA